MKSLLSRVGALARRSPPAPVRVPAWRPVFYKTLSVHLLETTVPRGRRRL